MSITSEKQTLMETKEQIDIALSTIVKIRTIYNSISDMEIIIEDYKDTDKFDQIPIEMKQALNAAYQLCVGLKTDLESNANIVEVMT